MHVSGHAPAGELRTLLNVAKPRYLMPVHGEWRHLRAHAALAEETGMTRDRVLLAEDGVVVDLVDGKASIVGSVPIGNVYVDGLNVGDVGEESLQARRILGDEGFVALTVVIEPSTRTIVRPVHLSTRGFSDDPAAFDEALQLVEENLKRALQDDEVDPHRLSQIVRRTVGKWVSDTHRRRPMIIHGPRGLAQLDRLDALARRELEAPHLGVEGQLAVQGRADVLRLPEAVLLTREQQVGVRHALLPERRHDRLRLGRQDHLVLALEHGQRGVEGVDVVDR